MATEDSFPGRGGRWAPTTAKPQAVTGPNKVVKKLLPGQAGTLRLVEQYGEALVCVRHRHDEHDLHRWTTVELVVEHRPVRGGADPHLLVKIARHEHALKDAVIAAGGHSSDDQHLWRLRRSAVRQLGLASRVVRPAPKLPP